jgi:hypothetical protein
MAGEMPFTGIEGTLYVNEVDQDADELVTEDWVRYAFVTGFNLDHNMNSTDIYDKYTKVGSKRGRDEISGSLGQGFALYDSNLMKLFVDHTPFAIKVEMQDDGEGDVVATFYATRVNFKDISLDFGDMNEGGNQVTFTGNYSAATYKWVDAPIEEEEEDEQPTP